MIEQRIHPRVQVSLPVTIESKRNFEGPSQNLPWRKASSFDLSCRGAGLNLPNLPDMNSFLQVSLDLGGHARPLQIFSSPVWHKAAKGPGFQVGVQFISMKSDDKAVLEGFIARQLDSPRA